MVVVIVVGLLATAGCTGDEPDPDRSTSSAPSGQTSSPGPTASPTPIPYVTPTAAPVLASGSGVLPRKAVPVTVGVLGVDAGPQGTRLRLRFSSASAVQPHPQALEGAKAASDIGSIELVAPSANQRLTAVYADFGDLLGDALCMCSQLPETIPPEGVDVSALYPPLPAGVTQVQVAVPGVAPITAPVNRT